MTTALGVGPEPDRPMLGHQLDKGHFIAHSMGGAVDGFEMNVLFHAGI